MKNPPLEEKNLLTLEETITLWDLSRRKFKRLREKGNLPFLIIYANRQMVIREQFEMYMKRPGAKEALTNGTRRI